MGVIVRFLFFIDVSDYNVEREWVKGEARILFVLITEFLAFFKICVFRMSASLSSD